MDGTVIHLGGYLGKLFGARWPGMNVSSPAEAIRAVDANLKGALKQYLSTQGRDKLYRVALGRKENGVDEKGIVGPSGQQDIYILPVVRGRNSGFGKILAGIAIIALVFATGGAALGAGGSLFGITAGTVGTIGLGLGASLILGGISQLLAPTPNFNNGQDTQGDSRGSTIFQGNATTISQGGAVGLVYGRMRVTPMPISMSITSYDQSAPASFAPGQYDNVTSPGNMVNVVPIDVNPIGNLPINNLF